MTGDTPAGNAARPCARARTLDRVLVRLDGPRHTLAQPSTHNGAPGQRHAVLLVSGAHSVPAFGGPALAKCISQLLTSSATQLTPHDGLCEGRKSN